MSKFKILTLIFIFFLPFFINAQGADLFLDTLNGSELDLLKDPTVKRARTVKINFDILPSSKSEADEMIKGRILNLSLFYDTEFNAVLSKSMVNSRGRLEWKGYLAGVDNSQVILIYRDGLMAGNIAVPGAFYQIRSAGDGVHIIRELDHSKFDQCAAEDEHVDIPENILGDSLSEPMADSGGTIDILVVYNAAARAGSGSTANIEAEIDLAITETNTGYSNSGVTQRVNLVHTAEVSYIEAVGDIFLDKNRLQGTSDGYMDDVHALRDTYGADCVVLITETGGGYCGVASLITIISTTQAYRAFCVVKRSCATGYYSFGHELGHIMAARHDRYVDPTYASPYTHNHGYTYLNSWRTIMAYSNACAGCTRLDYWSNPAVLYSGSIPMGVSGGDPVGADNHLTLNKTAYTVANFRQSVSAASITVTSPNGSESWEIGSTHNITWTATGLTNDVKITLWKDDSLVGLIVKDIDPSSGSYSWTAGTYTVGTASAGTGYKIKIREQGGVSFTTEDSSDTAFTLTPAPIITVTSPNGGEIWEIGSSHNITWTAIGLTNDVKLTLWKDDALVGLIVKNIDPSSGSYSWTAGTHIAGTALSGTGFKVKIREQGGVSFTTEDSSNTAFTLTSGPSITVTSPNGGEYWQIGTSRNITWVASSLTNDVKITLWKGGVLVGLIVKDIDPSSGSYSWTVGTHTSGTANFGTDYKIKIREQGGALFTTEDLSNAFFTLSY